MKKSSRRAMYFVMMGFVIFFIQGCGRVMGWHNKMQGEMMQMMGMGGHGGEQGATVLMPPALCQAASYLDYKVELGLTSDQIKELKNLELGCQKELITKEAEIKIAGLDYLTLIENLAKNKADQSTVEAKGKEIAELYTRMILIPLSYQEKAITVLTAEQKEHLGTVSSSDHKAGSHSH